MTTTDIYTDPATDDTYIYSESMNDTFGDNQNIFVKGHYNGISHGLIRIDVSSIPSSDIVVSATLRLNKGSSGDNPELKFTFHCIGGMEGTFRCKKRA